MGQYFVLVNLDKKEYIDIQGKLYEWCANNEARLLPFLLAKGPQDGTILVRVDPNRPVEEVIREANTPIGQGRFKMVGRWAGDRIVLVGDYDDSGLYHRAKDEFTDITEDVVREFNEFIGDDRFKVGISSAMTIRPDMIVTPYGIIDNPVIPPKDEFKDMPFKQKVKIIRKALKKLCKTLSVRMDRGTAYGWINIWGSGEFREFTDEEKRALEKFGLNYGANCALISPEDTDYYLKKALEILSQP